MQGLLQGGELLGQQVDLGVVLQGPALGESRRHGLAQLLVEQVVFFEQARGKIRWRAVLLGQWQGEAPDLVALLAAERGEVLVEAGQQVELGHQHVDREDDAELPVQLLQAFAQLVGVPRQFQRAAAQQVGDRDGEDDAVDGLPRAVLLQQAEKAVPLGAIDLLVAVLGAVAPGGIDQDRLVGEPPVALAGTADAFDGGLAEGARQGELQIRVEQRGGLARARCADEDVPGQLVQVLARQSLQRQAPAVVVEARMLERIDGGIEALHQRLLLGVVQTVFLAAGAQVFEQLAIGVGHAQLAPAETQENQ
ncbi:hypothetical protein D3C78_1056570 [compost metagenome]